MRAALRRSIRLPGVLLWLLLGSLLAAACALAKRLNMDSATTMRRNFCLLWMRGMLALLPVRIYRHGDLPDKPALWLSNHISWVDILVLGASARVQFLSKQEVRRWPLLGWLAASAGTLFLKRGAGAAAELRVQLSQQLQQRQSMVIFAEGTTTDGSRVLPFHSRLLDTEQPALRIQPIALSYRRAGQADQLIPFVGDDEFTSHLWQLLGSPTIEAHLHLLPALEMHAQTSRKQLAHTTQQQIADILGVPAVKRRRESQSTEVSRITANAPEVCATDLAWH